MNSDLLSMLPFAAIFAVAAGIGICRHLSLAKKRRQDYQWYLKEHPGAFRNGRVHCHACGGNRLSVQRLMNRTFTRAHVCSQCGTTLYYSKE